MAKRKTARLILLEFIDRVMERIRPDHEKLCEEGKCTSETPCPYCRAADAMMDELPKVYMKKASNG